MSCFDDGNCGAVQIEYDGNGSIKPFMFPFPYESQEEVHVEKWDPVNYRYNRINRDQWSFHELTEIEFVTPPDYTFRIMRETDLSEMEVTFFPGSSIRAQDLNTNFEQLQHAIQEGWCRVSDEFYCYLDEFIFDKRDAWTKEEQQNGQVDPKGEKIFLDDAITARHDVYLQDNKPTKLTYEQGGKRWYDTEEVNNYIWNDDIGAWVDYARTGPQGPKGADGHHMMIIGLKPPTMRPNGDPLCDGDLWFNNCTGEPWIYYDGTWLTLVNGGPVGPKGDKGDTGDDSTVEGPKGDDGEKGDTGDFHVICSLKPPTTRTNGDELKCGDLWFDTCKGELWAYYNGQWIGLSDSTGPQGPQGDQGPQGPGGLQGDPPGLQDPAAIAASLPHTSPASADVTQDDKGDLQFAFGIPKGVPGEKGDQGDQGEDGPQGNQGSIGDTPPADPNVGDLWFDTKCPSGQYIWDGDQWVGTSIPGPRGPEGRTTVIGDNPPANPLVGNLWFCTDCPDIGLYVWDGNQWVGLTIPGPPGANGTNGTDGQDGADGEGVPTGGTAGQVLAKIDATDFNTQWVDQTGGGGGGIPEAPNDGELYGRQSQAWAAINIPDPGIPEAPNDGQQYARQSQAWSVVAPPNNLNFIAPLQQTGDDVSFAWNSINALP
jgi:hypothetical protein